MEKKHVPQESVGQRIRALRLANNFTQEEFAAKLGVSRSAIAQWEPDRAGQRAVEGREAPRRAPSRGFGGSSSATPPPPMRAAMSRPLTLSRKIPAMLRSTLSPSTCPNVSLICLK